MNESALKSLLCELVDKGEEVSFTVHVGQFHQPSFKPKTKEDVKYLVDRTTAALGKGCQIEKKKNGSTSSYTIRKGIGYSFCFAYKEDK